jgi:hypothetical protein
MKELIMNENFTIYKKKDIYELKLENKKYSLRNKLINSLLITNIIKSGYNNENKDKIILKLNSIESLNDFLDRKKKDFKITKNINTINNIIKKIINDLVIQLNYLLENENSIFLGYNIENIIVINEDTFVFLDLNLIVDLDEKLNINIYYPYERDDFYFSHELNEIKNLPSKISYKTCYYSLGYLIINLIIKLYDKDNLLKLNLNDEKINEILDNLINENLISYKLYYFLQKCLERNIEDRFLLYI